MTLRDGWIHLMETMPCKPPARGISSALRSTALVAAIAAFSTSGWASNALAINALAEQAKFWDAKGRADLAAAAWQRLLLLDPNHTDALLAVIQFENENKRPEAARALAERLRKASGNDPQSVKKASESLAIKPLDTEMLEKARASARAGDSRSAVDFYRQYFRGQPPRGLIAAEYFQTLGGLPDKWDEARVGLATLVKDDPENAKISLAYAQHLTYGAASIRDGVVILTKLARQPEVGVKAVESLRKALTWLPANEDDIPLFQGYLTLRPSDEAMASRVKQLSQMRVFRQSGQASARTPGKAAIVSEVESAAPKSDPKSVALGAGYTALAAGGLDAAEKAFGGLLASSPNSPDALGGLGLVRMRQERLTDAEKLFADANKHSGGKAWGQALASVRFWLALDAGDKARAAGDRVSARRHYEAAAKLDDRHERPLYSLANLLTDEGRVADSEAAYKQLLNTFPDSLEVRQGLSQLLLSQNKVEEALALANGLSDEDKEAMGYGQLLSRQFQLKATALLSAGDTFGAMQNLEEALLLDSSNPWLRLQLARLYQGAGAVREANGLMQGLLQAYPDSPDVLHASALMSADAKDWAMGLVQLEKIPTGARTKAMVDLQRSLWVRAQVDSATVMAKSGQGERSLRTLERAHAAAGTDAELITAVALGALELGEEERALGLVRSLLAQKKTPDVDLRVQYAGLLLKTKQDVELAGLLRFLYKQPLSVSQKNAVDGIRWAYSVRQIDVQREAGNLASGYQIAAQLLREKPTDVSAQESLARLYSAAGEHALALSWYHQLLQKTPSNVPLLIASGTAAMQAGELAYAQAALEAAQLKAPNDAGVLSAMGRLSRLQGRNKQAVEYLERAQAVTRAKAGAEGVGVLSVGVLDYTMAGSAAQADSRSAVGNAMPLIPNPLGQVGPAEPQPTLPGSTLPVRPLAFPRGAPQSEFVPQADDPLPPGLSRPVMRPVQYRTLPQETPAPAFAQDPWAVPSGMAPLVTIPVQSAAPEPLRQGSGAARTDLPERLLAPMGLVPADTGRGTAARSIATRPTDPLQREIDDLRAQRSSRLGLGLGWQGRGGDSGTSELSNISSVVEGRFSAGESGQLVLRLEPVFLSAGNVSSTNVANSQQFGTNALSNVNGTVGTTRRQEDAGIGLSVGYESPRLKLDLGVTPLGFQRQNVVGGIDFNESWDALKLNLTFSRRAVTDSLLSYAGTMDDNSGLSWGGVTATGGRVQLSTEDGPVGLYGYGGLHVLNGKNVLSNNRVEMGAGVYYKFIQRPDFQMTSGLNLTAMGYKRNLRYFTLGHGGYFSPQRYLSLGVPIEVAGRSGRMSYRVDGALSLQNLRENDVAYFPGDTARQASWESLAAGSSTWKTFYPGQSKTGIGFRLGGEAEYLMTPHWAVGGQFSIDKSADFTMSSGLLYLKYHFDPVLSAVGFPPRALKVGN